jgi:hypothetical protein
MSNEPPRVPTPVVDYHHLRLVAEWASSMRNRQVDFAVRDGAVWLDEADPAPRRPALRVPAATAGRYGRVRALTMAVPGVPEPLDLAPYGVDALIWSEAAVEKFLVPFYASCAGPRAGRFLTGLFDAWNGDHGAVRAVALTHLAHTGGKAPLTLANTLGVVFRDDGDGSAAPALRLLPLGAFLARHPARWDPAPEPNRETVPLAAPELSAGTHLPTYPELRGIAEWAGSLRGRTGYLAYDPAPPAPGAAREDRTARIARPGVRHAGEIVFPVHTPLAVPDRPKPASVLLEPEDGGAPVDLCRHPHCDAVFTSTGAIEQFLFPYYASVRGALAMHELRRMWLAWTGAEPAAGTARTAGGDEPLALVHLPKSDWDAVEDDGVRIAAGSPLDQVGVVPAAGGREGAILTVRRWTEPERS